MLGVNVAGYAQSEKGVGEAMRNELRTLDAAGYPVRRQQLCRPLLHNRDASVDLCVRTRIR